ncbi:MAG TPA: nucleoside hydrolase [Roseiflexaceae bacterium]|nr:nucleoside hydrolase [Roseiflexaceae bacterium]
MRRVSVRRPFIIDTDMALDDWMALIYLLHEPTVDVRAITIAATGECHAGPGLDTALRLLALTNSAGVPVAAGRSTPLRGRQRFPLIVRLGMDTRLGLSLPRPRGRPARLPAVELLRRTILESPVPVTIVALGPLTNLAELLLSHPQLAERIAMIYVMGGALWVPGNIRDLQPRSDNRDAEWNVFIDPYAADVVLRSGAPVTLVPLDATADAPLTTAFAERCAAAQHTPAGRFLHQIIGRLRALAGGRPFFFWDPLTAALATEDWLGRYTELRLGVVQTPGREQGRVVEDPGGGLVRVCTQADAAAFEQIYLETVNTPLAYAPVPALGD